MYTFYLKTIIPQPVDTVFSLYTDREKISKWQPGFIREEITEDKKGRMRFIQTFRIGNRNMVITESILRHSFPSYDVEYRLKGIVNRVHNTFQAHGPDKTIWTSEITFRFRWLMKLIGPFMKKGLEKQSKMIMDNFKNYAERSSNLNEL